MGGRGAVLAIWALVATATVLLPNSSSTSVVAANADDDPTWNAGGPALLTWPDQVFVEAQAVSTDGSMFLVGTELTSSVQRAVVTRVTKTGAVDSTFGTAGTAPIQLPPGLGLLLGDGLDAAIQPTTGQLLIAGPIGATLGVVRLDASGGLDASFGNNGLARILSVGGLSSFNSIKLRVLPTGEMLLLTYGIDFAGFYSLSVVKLDANGSVESNFGNSGIAPAPLTNQPSNTVGTLGNVAVDSQGRVVAAATSPSNQPMVVRWTSTGQLDGSFANHGIVLDSSILGICGEDMAIDAHDRVVVVCPFSDHLSPRDPLAQVRRYLTDGSLDTTFGLDGIATVPTAGLHTYSQARHIGMQGDKIVIGGEVSEHDQFTGIGDAAVWRLTDHGQLDRSFGSGGSVVRDDFGVNERVDLLTVLGDGRVSVVVNNSTSDFTKPQVAVFRYTPATVVAEPSLNTITNPRRLLDTRIGLGAPTGKATPGVPVQLTVIGGDVPANAVAVALNVTVTEPDDPGYVTVYPCGRDAPVASNLNFVAGQTIPNAVIARVGVDGRVCLVASTRTHLVADITGWYGPHTDLRPLDVPKRMIDTRIGLGMLNATDTAKIVGDRTAKLWPGLFQNDPYLDEFVMNVTVTEPDAPGFVTVYQCENQRPLASNLNFVAGQTIANLVVARASTKNPFFPTGSVCFYSSSPTHLVVDVLATLNEGAAHRPQAAPTRLLDTRNGTGAAPGPVRAFTALPLHVTGVAGVPDDAVAVALNVTVTEPSTSGYVTVFPCGQEPPVASNLNFGPGQTIPNFAVARVGTNGDVCLLSNTPTQLVADLAEWYPAVS